MSSEIPSPAARLRALVARPGIRLMPCCFDALSARLVERAGFELTFMSGFAVSAARAGLPDTGLLSYGEMVDVGQAITGAISLPVIGDGDTGYGNAVNVKRTVRGYARAGFACVMIEDQLTPKRCGHTRGKAVVGRSEACVRIRAAVDAREELRNEGRDILVMARTDARATHGLDEAIDRARAFAEIGADILFVEAPKTERELEHIGGALAAPLMVNLVEDGDTPWLAPERLAELGFKIAAYPLALLGASVRAMRDALEQLREGRPAERRVSFPELREIVGFDWYDAEAGRYALRDGD
ncbi:MAG: bcpA [Deltaproteobacteria bacterium]|nr:bcpA [Deltaproteobacteria bacterium]